MAPTMMARGLRSSMEAAPVLSGGLLPLVWEEAGLVLEGFEVDRVALETVEFKPAEGLTVAEAATDLTLEMTAEADALAEETAADADAAAEDAADLAEETAEETAEDPPERGNWPE
jgi:hypothetical protein